MGLFEVTEAGFVLREHAPGWTPAEIQEQTEAEVLVAADLREMRVRAA